MVSEPERNSIAEVLRMIDEFMVRPDYTEWHTRSFLEQVKKRLLGLIKV